MVLYRPYVQGAIYITKSSYYSARKRNWDIRDRCILAA
jgi:hypothetical protein